MDAAITSTTCANCGAVLAGELCAECGQKVTALNPSLREFLHDLVHELAHFDGKIVQSVRLLLTKPGFLSREQPYGLVVVLTLATIWFPAVYVG